MVIEMERKIAIRTSDTYCIAIPNKIVESGYPVGTKVKITIQKIEAEDHE